MVSMRFKVKLGTVNNAVVFTAKCSEYSEDIDYFYKRYLVDAKSLVGIIGAGLEHVCEVYIHTDDSDVMKQFKEDIGLWIVEDK